VPDGRLSAVRRRIQSVVDLYATPLRAAHYLELLNPLWSSRTLTARVEQVWDETADSRTITLRPGRGWRRHRAGQHIRVGVAIDGRRFTRTYSISSSPERRDGCITITVKILDDGRMSRHLVRHLRVGSHLPISLPQGDFVAPESVPTRPLFVTGGSGVTPVMSILRTWALIGNVPDAVHIHFAPHEHDVIFGTELSALAETHRRYQHHRVLTRAGNASPGEHHLTEALLDERCPDWRSREVWACGPQSLLDSMEALGAEAGVRVRLERFRAGVAELDEDATGGAVTFLVPDADVVAVDADATTPLLRVAEDNGLNPDHGCRMGICHTCDVPLVAGQVRDLRTGQITDEAGTLVQICVSSAAGDCEIQL